MTMEDPPEHAIDIRTLHSNLDRALKTLAAAKDEKSERSCMGCLGGGASCFGFVVGLGLTACAAESRIPGIIVTILSAAAFAKSLAIYSERLPYQDDADRQLVAVGSKMTGLERLNVSRSGRDLLLKHLHNAEPGLAVAILNILAAVGGEESLFVTDALSDGSASITYASGNRRDVRTAAENTRKRIRDRLELAKRSKTLLRAADSADRQELLRPANSTRSDPDQLLRQQPYEEVED